MIKQRTVLPVVFVFCLLVAGISVLTAQNSDQKQRKVIRNISKHFSSDTLVFGIIPDVPSLKQTITSHRLAEALEDQQLQDFIQPLKEGKKLKDVQKKISDATGKSVDQLTDMVTGPVAVGVFEGEEGLYAEAEDSDQENSKHDHVEIEKKNGKRRIVDRSRHDNMLNVQSVVLAKVDKNQQTIENDIITSLIEKAKQKKKEKNGNELFKKTESYAGQTLHTMLTNTKEGTDVGPSWTFVNGFLLFVSEDSQPLLKRMVRRMQGDQPTKPLARTDSFARAFQEVPSSEMFLYANVRKFVEAKLEQAKSSSNNGDQQRGPSTVDVINGLGFTSYRGAVASLNLEENVTKLDVRMNYTSRKGLANILAFQPISPGEQGFSIPPSAVSGSVIGFSFKQMWEEGLKMMQEMSPQMSKMLTMQLNQVKKQYDVDIKKDILNSLGNRMYLVTFPPADEEVERNKKRRKVGSASQQAWVFSLQDRQRLKSAIHTLKTSAAKGKQIFSERTYLGTTMYSVRDEFSPGSGNSTKPTYAFLDGHLIYSNVPKHLETMIAHANRGDSGLFDQEAVQQGIDRISSRPSSFTYINLSSSLNATLQQLRTLVSGSGMRPEALDYINLDADVRPDTIRKYVQDVYGAFYMNDRRVRMNWHLEHSK